MRIVYFISGAEYDENYIVFDDGTDCIVKWFHENITCYIDAVDDTGRPIEYAFEKCHLSFEVWRQALLRWLAVKKVRMIEVEGIYRKYVSLVLEFCEARVVYKY